MPGKFQGKGRVSTRLQYWDYGWNAAYFVTICTKDRICYFGQVAGGTMQLSTIGQMAEQCWKAIPQHFPFVKLAAHVVMPNHVHGIVVIDKPDDGRNTGDISTSVGPQNFVAPNFIPPQIPKHDRSHKNKFGPQSQNLASIIRGFKIGVTKQARQIHADFAWQSRYHDHIIRNSRSFHTISEYIRNNPLKWSQDRFCE